MEVVDNITQTLKAQAAIFLTVSVPGEILKAVAETPEERQEIISKLPAAVKEQLAKVGAEIPTDLVDLSLDLGSFIFDIYYSRLTPPEAPLRKALFEKEKQEIAHRLSQKSFHLTDTIVTELKSVLSDDNLWKKVKISVYLGDPEGEDKNHFSFSYLIANNFTKIMDACINLCLPPQLRKEEPKKVAAAPAKKPEAPKKKRKSK